VVSDTTSCSKSSRSSHYSLNLRSCALRATSSADTGTSLSVHSRCKLVSLFPSRIWAKRGSPFWTWSGDEIVTSHVDSNITPQPNYVIAQTTWPERTPPKRVTLNTAATSDPTRLPAHNNTFRFIVSFSTPLTKTHTTSPKNVTSRI
jgi:hypothetical protein